MTIKFFLFLSIFFFGCVFSQTKNDELEVEKINQYSETIDKDKGAIEHQFQLKGKTKIVNYKYWKKQNEIVKISREWSEMQNNYVYTYTDYFVLKNEERVFANQSIVFKNKFDAEDVGGWSVNFWISKNKVIHMTSLGHGKTEDENWDFEKEIKENFNYMIEKVRKKEKEIKNSER